MPREKSQRELEQIQKNIEYGNKKLKVFIVDIVPSECCKRENMEDRMLELENLVTSFWAVVILEHIQKRWIPDYKTYIGSWKLDEIIEEMKLKEANLIIFGNILKSHQIYNVNQKLQKIWAKAWDRVDLILKIFEKNAKSMESKLQIELASIKHMWPRIFGMGMELSRQGWWSKLARWKWETNTQIMKRHLSKLEDNIKKELEKYKKVRSEHRKSRKRKWLLTVWIVWYTNAWKSSLLNSLTKKWVLSEDKLFATLWTSVWKMRISLDNHEKSLSLNYLHESQSSWWVDVLLNDTIWFIRDLPPELIDAFSSTLEDSIESDILFHVVDSSDPKIDEKIKVVDDILLKIWANQKKIYIFNKIDLLSKKELSELKKKFLDLDTIFISSSKKIGLDLIKNKLMDYIFSRN